MSESIQLSTFDGKLLVRKTSTPCLSGYWINYRKARTQRMNSWKTKKILRSNIEPHSVGLDNSVNSASTNLTSSVKLTP